MPITDSLILQNCHFPIDIQKLATLQESWLKHIDVSGSGWRQVHLDDLEEVFNPPRLEPANFHEILEVTGSIHALKKGEQVYILQISTIPIPPIL